MLLAVTESTTMLGQPAPTGEKSEAVLLVVRLRVYTSGSTTGLSDCANRELLPGRPGVPEQAAE